MFCACRVRSFFFLFCLGEPSRTEGKSYTVHLHQKGGELGSPHSRGSCNDSTQTARKTKCILRPCESVDAFSSPTLHWRKGLPKSFLLHHTRVRHMEEDTDVPSSTPPEMALWIPACYLFEELRFAVLGPGGQIYLHLSALLCFSDLLSDSKASCFSVSVSCYIFSHFIMKGLSGCSKNSSSRYCELQGKANSLCVVAKFKRLTPKYECNSPKLKQINEYKHFHIHGC